MERIILTRINPLVEQHLPPEQAGFREGKSTTDQVTRLVTDIEETFERKEKFGLLLIDLTAAYDTSGTKVSSTSYCRSSLISIL